MIPIETVDHVPCPMAIKNFDAISKYTPKLMYRETNPTKLITICRTENNTSNCFLLIFVPKKNVKRAPVAIPNNEHE